MAADRTPPSPESVPPPDRPDPPDPPELPEPPDPPDKQDSPNDPGRWRALRKLLGLTVLGTVLPGVGLLVAGRRKLALTPLVVTALVLAGAGYVLTTSRRELLHWMLEPTALLVIAVLLPLAAIGWATVVVWSYRALRPRTLTIVEARLGNAAVAVLVLLIVAPLAIGTRYALVQRGLIEDVFAHADSKSVTRPSNATRKDPWSGQDRVNVLLLGGDGGPDRIGVRTDTIIVASIDTRTGNTVLFGVPRNLRNIPFPPGFRPRRRLSGRTVRRFR